MNQKRSSELENVKWRVLSHIIQSSVYPPAKSLNGVPGQKAIAALEKFLHEAFLCIREEVLLKYLLPKSLEPETLREERKLLKPGASKIEVVTVGCMKSKFSSSSKKGVLVPTIHLNGLCLERSGFGIGEKITVFCDEKELILIPAGGSFNGLEPAEGGLANG